MGAGCIADYEAAEERRAAVSRSTDQMPDYDSNGRFITRGEKRQAAYDTVFGNNYGKKSWQLTETQRWTENKGKDWILRQ